MRTLLEIEEAISRLPAESQAQLIKDIPALCPDAFRRDGWAEILGNGAPRAGLRRWQGREPSSWLARRKPEDGRRFRRIRAGARRAP